MSNTPSGKPPRTVWIGVLLLFLLPVLLLLLLLLVVPGGEPFTYGL